MLIKTTDIVSTFWGLDIKEWLTAIGIVATFSIGLINFFNLLNINKRTVYVNTITTERVKWMGKLRELLSEYLSLSTYYSSKPIFEGEELNKFLERLIYLSQNIKLHLNHIDQRDEEINNLIQKINNLIFGVYSMSKIIKLPDNERVSAYINEFNNNNEIFNAVVSSMDQELIDIFLYHPDKLKDDSIKMKVAEFLHNSLQEHAKNNFGIKNKEELMRMTNELVNHGRIYLKNEWEKVKMEAQKGGY